MDSVAAGQYTLAVSTPSYQPLALPAVISDGHKTVLNAELRTGAPVEWQTSLRSLNVENMCLSGPALPPLTCHNFPDPRDPPPRRLHDHASG